MSPPNISTSLDLALLDGDDLVLPVGFGDPGIVFFVGLCGSGVDGRDVDFTLCAFDFWECALCTGNGADAFARTGFSSFCTIDGPVDES